MQLPAGAQTWISCGFDSSWTLNDHLTALLVDAVRAGNWQRGGDPKARKPDPLKRPADLRKDDASATRNDARAQAFLERQRRRQLEQTEGA